MDFVLFILILVGLILAHELGHFLAAKLLGVRVEEFAVGFPPRLLAMQKGETRYSLNLLLFGGYVRLFGETPEGAWNLSPADRARNLACKPAWVQTLITVAGVGMNLLFALAAFCAAYLIGMPVEASQADPRYLSGVQTIVEAVSANSPAAAAGLEPGDVILSATSGTGTLASQMSSVMLVAFTQQHPDTDMTLGIERAGKTRLVTVRPSYGVISGRAAIGVELADIGTEHLPAPLALAQGGESTWQATQAIAEGLGGFAAQLARGHADFSQVEGPVGIAQAGASSVGQGWAAAIIFAALISINLALLNLLPVPGLDGGRLLFIIIEKIKGSAVHPELVARITIAGFALLAALMIAITYHDIARVV